MKVKHDDGFMIIMQANHDYGFMVIMKVNHDDGWIPSDAQFPLAIGSEAALYRCCLVTT